MGRTSFELAARHRGLVLGVDVNVSMIRPGVPRPRGGRGAPRRQVGIV
ncbi:MAG: hypothetical protein R3F43_20280 [bacterium]